MTLHDLHTEYSQALRELAQTKHNNQAVVAEYEAALLHWREENAALVARHEAAISAQRTAAARLNTIEQQAREAIRTATPADLASLPAFARRRSTEMIYNVEEVSAACLRHAPFLMTVHEQRLKEFVRAHLIEDDEGYTLPGYIAGWLPVMPLLVWQPTLSEKKALAEPVAAAPVPAPDPVPEEVTL
jgi:hypothetical protein